MKKVTAIKIIRSQLVLFKNNEEMFHYDQFDDDLLKSCDEWLKFTSPIEKL